MRLYQHTCSSVISTANTLFVVVQCNEEIGRLEAEQAKAMKVMIQSKSAEIARICEETCLPVPNLGVLVDDSENVGQVLTHHFCTGCPVLEPQAWEIQKI